jgi:hypothetical protein
MSILIKAAPSLAKHQSIQYIIEGKQQKNIDIILTVENQE